MELPNLPPLMLAKADEATTYATRDLATIAYRKKRWQPDLYLYEVGADQKLHFQQLQDKISGKKPVGLLKKKG